MTPDLSYNTTGREGESSARIINWMEEYTDRKSRTAFQKSYTRQLIKAVQWGYPDSRSPWEKPKQALIALICFLGNTYMDVSVSGHGDLTVFMYVPNGFIFDVLGTYCIDSS